MLSKILAVPFGFLLIYTVYITMYDNNWYSLYIIPPVIILAVIYVFSNQIDWWWHKRRTPELPEVLLNFLKENGLWYDQLTEAETAIFNQRLSLYMLGIDFQEMNPTPEKQHFRVLAAYFPVLFSLHKENFLFEPFERLIFYNHPFPSPKNQQLHHSETEFEDGVIIFNKDSLHLSFGKEKQVFSVAMYEYLKVMIHQYETLQQVLAPYGWEELSALANPDKAAIMRSFGYKELDEKAIFLMSIWLYSSKCQVAYPDLFEKLAAFFQHSFFKKLMNAESNEIEAN